MPDKKDYITKQEFEGAMDDLNRTLSKQLKAVPDLAKKVNIMYLLLTGETGSEHLSVGL